MSTSEEAAYYIELQPGDKVQVWDQWLDQFGQWQFYTFFRDTKGVVGDGVRARRPIRTTHQTTLEEVPGSRTSQQAIDQPQRERIAYEELQPGDVIQPGDEWQHESGRWKPFASLDGSCVQVRHTQRARRPHSITMMLAAFASQAEVLANAQKAATQLQDERDELREALAAEQLAHKVTMMSGLDACKDRDEALAEVARLSAKVSALKPLEDRITSLVEELAQARAGGQQLLKTIAENADEFGEYTKDLARQRDEAEVELKRLQDVVSNLYSEPTARQVQDMLRTWATELDWAAGCFDSVGREQIDTIQKTLIAVMERIDMLYPEGDTDGE